MLRVSQLSRSYGDFLAVDKVSFEIQQGEIVGLLGHNGAGKTTIMKMLSGFLEPDQGEIYISNTDMLAEPKLAQSDLGYLPESLPVYPEMTVADYLDYAADLKGINNKAAEIKRAIKATDIGVKLLSPISTLSRGYKQRVGVAQAILGQPKVVILDEPTNGLDPTQTEHMRVLIKEIAQQATVILSTHIMQEVDALCDRVLIVNAGALAVDARLDELRSSNQLLLGCSMLLKAVKGCLGAIPSITNIAAIEGEKNLFRVELDESSDLPVVSATIAKAVVDAGEYLYQIAPVQYDLETLFRGSSATQGGVKHAA